MDPESVGASQALSDPSKADGEELTGTLDGEGNGALWRVGHTLSCLWGLPFSWGKGNHLGYLLANLGL